MAAATPSSAFNHEFQDDDPQILDLLSLQCSEFALASVSASDLELAFQLQLQEALSASTGALKSQPADSLPVADSDDLSVALELQNLELSRRQQEVLDKKVALEETEHLKRALLQRRHDAKVAKTISEMADEYWEDQGDNYEEPFLSEQVQLDDSRRPCQLFFTVATSGQPNGMILGMGATILDYENNVLTELHKPLDQCTGKTVADYVALIAGLAALHSLGVRYVHAHTDSVTVYNQVTGHWKIRNRKMLNLWSQVMDYVHKLQSFEILLHPKNENTHALRLAREVLDQELAKRGNDFGASSDGKTMQSVERCEICLEDKTLKDMFILSSCQHRFCLSCIIQHAEVKVQAGQVPVRCLQAECSCVLSLDECRSVLSQKWFELVIKRLTEASIPESERVYCPFPNCSALMTKDGIENLQHASTSSHPHATSSGCVECMECHRLFCLECQVPWHASISCSEYQLLPPHKQNALDAELYRLAKHQKWQRCKKCRRMIELSEGCNHMTCRCGYEFCYACGAEWIHKKQTCKCALWDEQNLLHEPLLESEEEYDDEEWEDEYPDSEDEEDGSLEEGDDDQCYEFGIDHTTNNWGEESHRQRMKNPFYKSRLCRYWERGNCWAGNGCNFAHGNHELR